VEDLQREVRELRALIEELSKKVAAIEKSPAAAVAPPTVTPAPAAAKSAEQLALERALAAELGGSAAAEPAATPVPPPSWSPASAVTVAGGGKNYLNLSFDGLFAAGTSTTADVARIETGGHDPAARGFTVQNAEMVLQGAVDPYLTGQGNVVFQLDRYGETTVELEEAYLTTTSLPWNLQLKGGTYFSELGRLNPQHPHAWDFVDQPLVSGRFLGPDGLRGPGARLSWLLPTRFYAEFLLSVQDGNGEIAATFRNVPGEIYLGRPVEERPLRGLGDLLYVPRLTSSFDLTSTRTVVLGVSGALGPNASGADTRTRILGADLFYKWKPANAQAGFPFAKWQTEVMHRTYEAGALAADGEDGDLAAGLPAERLRDWGAYSQVLWGFRRGWVAGLRYDYLDGSSGTLVSVAEQEQRWRLAPNLTWYPSEFSKVRLQFNHDILDRAGNEDSLWLQFEFMIGAHGAHKF
jgi:hypothetical protein